jgi:hypothetical protein
MLNVSGKYISPGINVFSPEAGAVLLKNEMVKEQIEHGYLTVVQKSLPNEKSIPGKGKPELDAAMNLASLPEEKALEAVAGVQDAFVLNELIRPGICRNATVVNAAKYRLEIISAEQGIPNETKKG